MCLASYTWLKPLIQPASSKPLLKSGNIEFRHAVENQAITHLIPTTFEWTQHVREIAVTFLASCTKAKLLHLAATCLETSFSGAPARNSVDETSLVVSLQCVITWLQLQQFCPIASFPSFEICLPKMLQYDMNLCLEKIVHVQEPECKAHPSQKLTGCA